MESLKKNLRNTAVLGWEDGKAAEDEQNRLRILTTMEYSTKNALLLLHAGQPENALPEAREALRFATEAYGTGNIELVRSYLILAEVYTCMGRFDRAELNLSHAKWSVLKQETSNNDIKAAMCRGFGLLYATQKNISESLRSLANYSYYLAVDYGAEHIKTSVAFFHMGNVFLADNRTSEGMAFFNKVAHVWNNYLRRHVNLEGKDEVKSLAMCVAGVGSNDEKEQPLSTVDEAEALHVLSTILGACEATLGVHHKLTAEVHEIMALLNIMLKDFESAIPESRLCLRSSTRPPTRCYQDGDRFS